MANCASVLIARQTHAWAAAILWNELDPGGFECGSYLIHSRLLQRLTSLEANNGLGGNPGFF